MLHRFIYFSILAFVLGLLSAGVALIGELYFTPKTQGYDDDYYIIFFDNFFSVSLVEELSKFGSVFLLYKLFKSNTQLLFLAAFVGLGFSVFEEGLYLYHSEGNIRLLIPFFFHIFLTVIQMRTLSIGRNDDVNKYFYTHMAWTLTWIAHGLYDFSITLHIDWVWMTLFVVLMISTCYILFFPSKKETSPALENDPAEEENDFGFFR